MDISREATAGTLESSDVMVSVSPSPDLQITINSPVAALFGEAIEACIRDTLATMGVTGAYVFANDKGARDFVIRARVECAVRRAAGEETPL